MNRQKSFKFHTYFSYNKKSEFTVVFKEGISEGEFRKRIPTIIQQLVFELSKNE